MLVVLLLLLLLVLPQWGATTDLMPTFLEAAGLQKPTRVRIDGVSLLPVLKQAAAGPAAALKGPAKHRHKEKHAASGASANISSANPTGPSGVARWSSPALHSRVFLWHKDTDPYRQDEGHEVHMNNNREVTFLTRHRNFFLFNTAIVLMSY